MEAKERENFVKAWDNHINDFNTLAFTPSEEIRAEVKATMSKMKELVQKVADDKITATIKRKGEVKA